MDEGAYMCIPMLACVHIPVCAKGGSLSVGRGRDDTQSGGLVC